MNLCYWIIEIGTTYIENIIILASVTRSSDIKFSKRLHIPLLFLFSALTTMIVDTMNQIQDFSYLTPLLSMAFVIFISSRILSNGSLLLRSISAILSSFLAAIVYLPAPDIHLFLKNLRKLVLS